MSEILRRIIKNDPARKTVLVEVRGGGKLDLLRSSERPMCSGRKSKFFLSLLKATSFWNCGESMVDINICYGGNLIPSHREQAAFLDSKPEKFSSSIVALFIKLIFLF